MRQTKIAVSSVGQVAFESVMKVELLAGKNGQWNEPVIEWIEQSWGGAKG